MFKTDVICPDGLIYEGEADMLEVPGMTSNFSILKDHTPLVSELNIGICTIYKKEKEIKFSVQGGFVEILDNRVTALVEKVLYPDDIRIKAEEAELQKLLSLQTFSDEEYKEKEKKIRICRVNLLLAQKS